MGRTVVVGDVHGCAHELTLLLDLVHFGPGDMLYFLGDLLARGPDPKGVLAIARQTGAQGVRGNHDDVLVQWRAAERAGETTPQNMGKKQQKLAERLDDADFDLLESLPLWLDLERHEVRLVHAGVIPGLQMEAHPRKALLTMRYLGPECEPIEKGGTVLWGTRYVGPPHVVFGHNAQPEPQLHPWATGIDTAAVYGGRLSALVLEADQPVPPLDQRKSVIYSVPAGARYYEP
jgi:hypothetical protein